MEKNLKDTVKRYSIGTPKSLKERLTWLRENNQDFKKEEEIINEVKRKSKQK